MTKYKVLVVDDHAPWRGHIRQTLADHSIWRIVDEAVDGVDAVDKARMLCPDVILLDISLPRFDGIEAARRILANEPASMILFVSESRDVDVVKAALESGGRGFVLKSDGPQSLLAALDAMLCGRRYVSPRLGLVEASERTPHHVGFYEDEAQLLDDYAVTAEEALLSGNTFVVVADRSRCEKLRERLVARGIDIHRAIAEDRYASAEPADVLARFMVNGWPDETLFRAAAMSLVAIAGQRDGARLVVCGECAPTLVRAGQLDAAIRVEELWDAFARVHHIDTLCGYIKDIGEAWVAQLERRIGDTHSSVRAAPA